MEKKIWRKWLLSGPKFKRVRRRRLKLLLLSLGILPVYGRVTLNISWPHLVYLMRLMRTMPNFLKLTILRRSILVQFPQGERRSQFLLLIPKKGWPRWFRLEMENVEPFCYFS
jgi:hypothetical protein